MDDLTDATIVTLIVVTPVTELAFTAELIVQGRTMFARRAHVQGAHAGAVGAAT